VNTDAPWPTPEEAAARVLGIQTKLHRWANDDSDRRFDDLFNLVCDPAFLVEAWRRVRGNRGARSAGVDGVRARSLDADGEAHLRRLREDLKARRFRPLPVRERMIPKASGKLRRLGIPTVRDRIVQGALKLVLEPIFEADFKPCSYGFRPRRRAQDAIAEIYNLASNSYEWVVEGDISDCFDSIGHSALLGRVRARIVDRRVLELVKAFLKAGVLTEEHARRDTTSGTPQGGILSPLLANIALSALDERFMGDWQEAMATRWQRERRRHHGLPTYRLVRYADDFVVMVSGTEAHAEELRDRAAAALTPMGLRLSAEKTRITHLDEGFDFLGFRVRRDRRRGTKGTRFVYTYPAKKALAAVKARVRAITRQGTNHPLSSLLRQLNLLLRGWTTYFRNAVSARTFGYLHQFTWVRVIRWLRRKHPRLNWRELRRRHLGGGWWPEQDGVVLFDPARVAITRYRFRGANIPTPWERTMD
jgi:RNA-directed DNA polymerase